MRRWNAWGEDEQAAPLIESARAFLRERIGDGTPLRDARLETILATIAESRLSALPFETGAESRLRHARGQSYRDWLALKYGRIGRP